MSDRVIAACGGRAFELAFATPNDHIANVIRQTGTFYEAEMLADARSRLFFAECAVDVGAHVGNHTVYFAGVLGLRTVSFEPNIESFTRLVANIEVNQLGASCRPVNIALGAGDGRGRTILDHSSNSGMTRVEAAVDGDVEIASLDQMLVDEPQVDLIKVDVEGWELAVLTGATSTLDRCRPLLYVETSVQNFPQLTQMLAGQRYVCWKRFNSTPTFLFLPAERLAPPTR